MRHLLIVLLLLIGVDIYAQKPSVWFPENLKLSEDYIHHSFENSKEEVVVLGGRPGFFGVFDSSRVLDLFYFDSDLVSVLVDGYETDSGYVFLGNLSNSDLVSEHKIVWLEVDWSGNILRKASVNSYHEIASHGLIQIDGGDDMVVSSKGIYQVKDTALVPLLFRPEILLNSAAFLDSTLYVTSPDHVFEFEGDSLKSIGQYSFIENLFFDGNKGAYLIRRSSVWYTPDIRSVPQFQFVNTLNVVRGQKSFANIASRRILDTVLIASPVSFQHDEFLNYIIKYFEGNPIDTFEVTTDHFFFHHCTTLKNNPIGIGRQQCCGDFYSEGICFFDHSTMEDPKYDIGVDLQIDSSYWVYDTNPHNQIVYKTHYWDYTVEITNHSQDTVTRCIVFEPQSVKVFVFKFRDKYKIDNAIAPGATYYLSSRSNSYTFDKQMSEYCLSVDLPNSKFDSDYSNNSTCTDIPPPRSVSTRDIFNGTAIYPNPTSGLIHIKSDLNDFQVELYSIQGDILLKTENSQSVIDVNSLNDGLYYMLIKKDQQSFAKTIVVHR